PVPSACCRNPPVGSGFDRSKTPILSSPRKPPEKRLFPSASLRFTHQLKLSSSFWNTLSRNAVSRWPRGPVILYTRHAAHACTGGFTSPKAHSYAGSWPFGCMYHSRSISINCSFANSESTRARGTQWNARSHAAYHGYSHLSGIEITSALYMC